MNNNEWLVSAKPADFTLIASKYSISPITARLMVNRGLNSHADIRKYLSSDMKLFHNADAMKDMSRGIQVVKGMIDSNAKIRIIGDYDVDGICATYILYRTLKELGAIVDFVIPDRVVDGYGLNSHLIEDAYGAGIKCILTCDNGISATEQADLAKSLGIAVVITDHHEVPYSEENGSRVYHIPNADAVIDPKQIDCQYPYDAICGAFVAYKFADKLMRAYGVISLPEELLMFASIATVCDVMELTDENRILVKNGLNIMTEDCCNTGLKALLRQNKLEGIKITPYHLGFVIGPCINATGRLETADKALRLFLEKDEEKADELARELIKLNDMRKQMTEEGIRAAEEIVEKQCSKDKVLVVLLEKCHESIVGIIAGRLKEKYGKPSFVFTLTDKGYKGSGRSIEKYSMYEELTKHKELLSSYGGHPMAAGVSVATKEDLDTLKTQLNEGCFLTDKDYCVTHHIDMELLPLDIDLSTVEEFAVLEPFGVGNKKPLFVCRDIKLMAVRVMGVNKNVCRFSMLDKNGKSFSMIRFSPLETIWKYISEKYPNLKEEDLTEKEKDNGIVLSIVFQADVNEYNGNKSVQYVIQDIR